MPDHHYTRETLSRAEDIIVDVLSRPLSYPHRSTWKELTEEQKKVTEREAIRVRKEVAKGLDLRESTAAELTKMVMMRRETVAVLAVFTGAQTLTEAAREARMFPIDLAKALEVRRPALEEAFDRETRELLRSLGPVGWFNDATLSRDPTYIRGQIDYFSLDRGKRETGVKRSL
jgi:hypothetical protein